jgi:hypothetical protein
MPPISRPDYASITDLAPRSRLRASAVSIRNARSSSTAP